MSNAMFTYNQEQAVAADSGGAHFTESAVARGHIRKALWKNAQNSKAELIELTFETESGQSVNYLTIYHKKKDGSPNDFGIQRIQSIMGCTGVRELSTHQEPDGALTCPELKDKQVAFALERENYRNANGEDKFKFDIKAVMSARTWITMAEHQGNKGADTKAYWEKRFAENPNGNALPPLTQANYGGGQPQGGYGTPPVDAYDDDNFPF